MGNRSGSPSPLPGMLAGTWMLPRQMRRELLARLRRSVAAQPDAPELRLLLAMALCADLQLRAALEEMRSASGPVPGSFVAALGVFAEFGRHLHAAGMPTTVNRRGQP